MSSFGSNFRVTTFGESHCKAVGVIVDGVPPGMPLTEDDVQPQLSRRRPGQSNLTTPRDEKDRVSILSGTEKGFTLGTPIAMTVPNQDQRPHDYGEMDYYPRPSHADFTYLAKYGIKASSGGGRSSARETIGRVAAAGVAEKFLKLTHNVEIVAFVASIGHVTMEPMSGYGKPEEEAEWLARWEKWWGTLKTISREQVDANEVRCPDAEISQRMRERIIAAKEANDSIGGSIVCVIRNVPAGLGEPCFDKLEAKLAHAMMSIPATKGFEIGSGFAGTDIPGHVHNDPFVLRGGKLGTKTNFSGGVQGGISNGENIYFKIAFKPPATIGQAQATATYDGVSGTLAAKGRHDPCVLPRAVPIVEAMSALVIMDALLQQLGRQGASTLLPADLEIPPVLKGELGKSKVVGQVKEADGTHTVQLPKA
ncbi:chorismate synthase [Spizellomyces punctatus DAOM BR117]|uniref:Chorismate synthase n=1 Tax=Spizellomyces punctatus (strain DAOM BR117) TaxID=645134 RepID=A0A0L0HNY1_SPIPD|nr:chorismate synthase [Spizellomyces punctatus DAOM BR117]KND02763.1 chorismate synthase [Spizellomyces punctatus DAOM BR117]|eukprot:XP_016610802.1 chorismate synthase [Spizellomyces punctatus DAOM BR117]